MLLLGVHVCDFFFFFSVVPSFSVVRWCSGQGGDSDDEKTMSKRREKCSVHGYQTTRHGSR